MWMNYYYSWSAFWDFPIKSKSNDLGSVWTHFQVHSKCYIPLLSSQVVFQTINTGKTTYQLISTLLSLFPDNDCFKVVFQRLLILVYTATNRPISTLLSLLLDYDRLGYKNYNVRPVMINPAHSSSSSRRSPKGRTPSPLSGSGILNTDTLYWTFMWLKYKLRY